jgi:hypothetical protein
MTEMDRRSALACLAAVEVNLGELRGIPTWWKMLGQGQRQEFDEFAATVRAYQHGLQGPSWFWAKGDANASEFSPSGEDVG